MGPGRTLATFLRLELAFFLPISLLASEGIMQRTFWLIKNQLSGPLLIEISYVLWACALCE